MNVGGIAVTSGPKIYVYVFLQFGLSNSSPPKLPMKQTKIYNLQHDFVFVFEANSDFPSVIFYRI